MRTLSLFILIIFISCSRKNKVKEAVNGDLQDLNYKNEKYKMIVDAETAVYSFLQKNKISFLNDTAQWYLFNVYCDFPIPASVSNDTSINLSFLVIKPTSYSFSEDSTDLNIGYGFFYNDTINVVPLFSGKKKEVAYGVQFNFKTKSLNGFFGHLYALNKELGEKSRYTKLLQPEVISFVQKNWYRINDSYRVSLVKHGINFGGREISYQGIPMGNN